MTNNCGWKVSYDKQFIADVKHWKTKVADLQVELRAIVEYILEYGEIPSEYDPHRLIDSTLPYTGNLEFHLYDGRIDLLVIYV